MYKLLVLACASYLLAGLVWYLGRPDVSPPCMPPEGFTSIKTEEGSKESDYAELAKSVAEGDTYSRVIEIMGNPISKNVFSTKPKNKNSFELAYTLKYCIAADNIYRKRYIIFTFDRNGILSDICKPGMDYTEAMQAIANEKL